MALWIGLLLIVGCSKESLTDLDGNAPQPVQSYKTLSDIKCQLKGDVLSFETTQDFNQAITLLDTASIATRMAWEAELGFRSMRLVFEQALDQYLNDSAFNQSPYKHLITFDTEGPMLLDYSDYVASVLNENGKVMVAGSLGSLRLEGCYWVSNENATSLDKLILKKKHDPENGLYAFDAPAFVEEKSCSNGFPNSHWSSTKVVSNGNGKGAARLQGWANFNYVVTPGSGPDMFDALLTFRLRGVSYRKGRRRWKKERTNHTFNWDFRVDRLGLNLETGVWVSIDPRDFSGTDTHNNNQEAIRTVQVGNFPMNGNAVILTRMVLETVRTGTLNGGTSQTTNQLSPSFVSYGCQ